VRRSAAHRTDRHPAIASNPDVNALQSPRTPIRPRPTAVPVLPRLPEDEVQRLEAKVDRQTAQLIELTQHLLTVREEERARLARDLHDELGSLLTSAKLDAARLRSRLSAGAPEALPLLAHLVTLLDAGIALKRNIVEALQPSALSNLGLAEALEILARDFGERSGLTVHRKLEEVALAPAAALVVYRLVQEAITNITKYADPAHVWISLTTRHDRVVVTVQDDGAGFDVAAAPRSAYGLIGMRYRVEAERGTLVVESAPGHGTLVRASLPRSAKASANGHLE
jgi:signal transduction histidine kinase